MRRRPERIRRRYTSRNHIPAYLLAIKRDDPYCVGASQGPMALYEQTGFRTEFCAFLVYSQAYPQE